MCFFLVTWYLFCFVTPARCWKLLFLLMGLAFFFGEPVRCFIGPMRSLFQASSSSRSVAQARWEEFRNNAVNQGAEWLRGSLEQMGRDELRSVDVAGGIRAKIDDRWLPVAQLRSALMEALAPTEQAQLLCFGYR